MEDADPTASSSSEAIIDIDDIPTAAAFVVGVPSRPRVGLGWLVQRAAPVSEVAPYILLSTCGNPYVCRVVPEVITF